MQRRTGTAGALLWVIGAWLAVVSVTAHGQAADDQAAELRSYYSGNGLLNRGMYDLAIAEYRAFLQEHPEHPKAAVARYGLAVSLFRLGRLDEAAAEVEALDAAPDFEFAAEALMILGQSRLALKRPQEAATAFAAVMRDHAASDLADEAAALQAEALYEAGAFDQVQRPCRIMSSRWPDSPHRPRAELFCGLAEMALGDDVAAAERFEQMSRRWPDGEHADRVALLLAQCRHRTGGWEQAAALYRQVIGSDDDQLVPEAMYGLAVVEHRAGDERAAARLLDRFLQQYPDHDLAPAARLASGRVLFDMGEYDQAQEAFGALGGADGVDGDEVAYWMAKTQLRRGDAAGAARRLEQALASFPESELAAPMTYDRAVALSRSGDADAALQVLGDFRTRFPDHPLTPDAVHLAAATLHQQGRYADSLGACRAFAGRYPQHALAPAIAFLAAENQYLLKDHRAAAQAYQALLRRYPQHPQAAEARFRLGLCLYEQGSFDDAQRLLAEVVDGRRTRPQFRAALLAVGDAHFQNGRWEQARQYLADYLAAGPDDESAADALLKLGLSQRRLGEQDAALRTFEQLLDLPIACPQQLHARFEQGLILSELRRAEQAAAAFEQVVEQGPDSPFAGHALNHLGAMAREDGRQIDAASAFGRAAESFEALPAGAQDADLVAEALFQQGQSLLAAQQFQEAAVVLGRLADEHPACERLGHASALRAIALARQGDRPGYEQALAAIGEVESGYRDQLDPSLRASLLYEKAWCLRELGRAEEAMDAYRAMIKAAETAEAATAGQRAPVGHAMLELAELEVEAERYGEAADLLRSLQGRHAADLSPDLSAKAGYTLGVCEYHLGDMKAAAGHLEAYLAGEPDGALVVSATVLCAEALQGTGRYRQAAEHLARVVESHAGDDAWGPSLLRLGECRARLQDWPDSEAAFRTYLGRFPDSELWFQARFGIGWALENQGQYEEAADEYRKVVQRHQGPTAARAQFQIGECLFARKQYEEAVRQLLKVDILYAYPQWSAGALYEAGRCFQQMGSPVEARKQFEKVRREHPESEWAPMAQARLDELGARGLPGHEGP